LPWTKILTKIPPMDTFTFTVQTGPVSVFFHGEPVVPAFTQAGGLYVADDNTAPLLRSCRGFDPHAPLVILKAGEAEKTLQSVERILTAALEAGLARDSLFVGIGGGVVTDMTAFAASIYMRGARLELVPTTLLAMVDASVGGKTGVDYGAYKNCVGSFYPASSIHMAVSFLKTLPEHEFRSGLAEVVKTALLYAPKLFQILQERRSELLDRDPELLLETVKRCVQAKARVVERDLKETGERAFLNLGHTFAHALESVAGFGNISHGDAVAWGISRALELGLRMGITDGEYCAEVRALLSSYGWCVDSRHPVLGGRDASRELLEAMQRDKKKKDGTLRFILQREMNSTLIETVPPSEVLAVLA